MNAFFRWYYTADLVNDGTLGLLAKSGLAPVPKNWRVAINETFTGNTSGLGLNLDVPGAGACTAATIVGG